MNIASEIRSIFDGMLEWLGFGEGSAGEPDPEVVSSSRGADPAPSAIAEKAPSDAREQARVYLDKVRAKTRKLAEDFNAGRINRAQFQNLYSHYEREIRNIMGLLESTPSAEDWKGAVTEGKSVFIRHRHMARALGYAIYENESGMPFSTLGEFDIDPALLVPMLSAYRSAAKEIFGAGMRSTAIEGGRWLCFVPGEFTTMLAVFTTEPAGKQLSFLEELHRLFEKANRRHLADRPLHPHKLLFPHEYYLGQWRR